MKFLPLVFLVLVSSFLHAGDFRTWTEASTKKTIEGTITDKKSDSSAAKIVTKEDRTVWLDASKLTSGDQDFIKKWISPGGRLSAKVIASGKKPGRPGWKQIQVSYAAGATPMTIKWIGKGIREVEAGGQGEFTFKVGDDYWVAAYVDGKEVDRETDKRKTGL